MAEADLTDVLSPIDVPAPAPLRRPGRPLTVGVGRGLHAGISGSSLVILPGVGHFSSLEGPEQFNREVRSFLLDNNRD